MTRHRPSPHLTFAELACKDGTPYPIEFILDGRLARLAVVFEAIRAAAGHKPIAVVSAYRSPEYNRRIGGARHSQHVQGRALDLQPPSGISVGRFHALITELARTHLKDLKGIGRYRTFVHIDTRPSMRLVAWTGTGAKDTLR
ncbi:MAG TPA: D-Ala-D-Ala carboxypeptidase family metallohydrolase [Vicinamibacterales bacterium]|nr:D-Ala-D-Ala carboxypeptidase family metallohydrolase [Vicinamibacterales bacterium]